MMTEKRAFARKSVAIALVLAVLLGFGFLYLGGRMTDQQTASAETATSSLQSSVSRSVGGYQGVQVSGSALTTSASSTTTASSMALGIDPEAIYALANRSVVTVQGDVQVTSNTFLGPQTTAEIVLGSGFVTIFGNKPYVITNYHVVEGVSNLSVTFSDGNAYAGKVVGSDPYSDLAVVSVQGAASSDYSTLQLAPSTGVNVGEPVVAIGNPFGLSGSLTYGIISQLGRTLQDPTAGNFSISDVIQFSAPINPGNSGGPLLDSNGMVIGITTAIVSGSQGLGFAIPSDTILREMPSLVSTGSYRMHPYLGIGGVDMNYELAKAAGTNVTYGVLLEDIVNNGPASKAGLHAGNRAVVVEGQQYLVGGDIIISINGVRIINQEALATYLETNTIAGQTIQVGIIRNGSVMTVPLVLGTRPALPGQ